MSDKDRVDQRLKGAYAAPSDGAPRTHCPPDERIWAASRGELSRLETTALLAHSQECDLCADSFRAAAAIAAEAGLEAVPGRVHAFPSRRRTITLAALAAAAALVLLALFFRPAPQEISTPSSAVPSVAPVAATGFARSVQATLWLAGDGADAPLSEGWRIRPGDRLYIQVRNDRPAYVYVINRDQTGEASVLFPVEGAQWTNPLPPGDQTRLPGEPASEYDSWEVTSAGGRESFMVLASATPLEGIEAAITMMSQALPAGPDAYLRGEAGEGTGPVADEEAAAASLAAALEALTGSDPQSGDLYVRTITLENPR